MQGGAYAPASRRELACRARLPRPAGGPLPVLPRPAGGPFPACPT